MQKYRDIAIDATGNAVLSATITVTNASDNSLATIYSDNGVTQIAGSVFTSSGANGVYEFYAADGRYNITVAKTGYDTATISDILLNDQVALKYTSDIAALKDTPNKITTAYFDNNKTIGSGADWIFTNTRITGNAGLGLHTDGYVYNDNGDKYGNAKFIVNVKAYGALGDGSTDDNSAMLSAHATGYNVDYPQGHYITSATVQAVKGQAAYGAKGTRFENDELRSIIECSASTTAVFSQTTSVEVDQEDGFSCYDILLKSDIGIRLNDETVTISSGGASPYLMKSEIKRCSFIPKTNGVGIGIIMSKCFDFNIEQCDFDFNARSLIMQGCDIGKVYNNRFTSFEEYAILELSTGTFGSQNLITGNDFVVGADTAAIFIKSTSRHPRIIDNYMEQTSTNVAGFIDLTDTSVPTYGSNTVSSTRYTSVEVDKNRIDGHDKASSFIYRYEPGTSSSVKIHDVGTIGAAPSVPWLTVESDGFMPRVTAVNMAKFDISGGRGNDGEDYYQFKTKPVQRTTKGVYFDAESLVNLDRGELARNNSIDKVRIRDAGIVILPTLGTTYLHCILPSRDGVSNSWLKDTVLYNVNIVARAEVGTETLRAIKIVDAGGVGSATDTVLTTQNKTIRFLFTGTASTTEVGLAFANQTGTPTNNIIVQSVSFEEVDVAALTDSTGGTANDTLVAISGSGDDSEINNNFADLAAKINEILTKL